MPRQPRTSCPRPLDTKDMTLNEVLTALGISKTNNNPGSGKVLVEGIGSVSAGECWAWLRKEGLIK